MKVYIVRHGETMENASNCLVGRINSSLTEEGIRQAKQVRDYFKDKNIDLIISSTLDRCKQTAEIISDGNIEVRYTDKLLGRDHGEFTGAPRDSINYDEYWNYYKNIKYERAESVKDLYDRAVKVLTDLKKDYDDKSIVVVTHSGIIRVLYYYFNGIPEDGALGEVTIKNCGVYEYDL